MIVARQFIAWYRCKNGTRPAGHGMIGSDRRVTIRTTNQPWVINHTVPYGTVPTRRHADTPIRSSGSKLNPWLKLLFPYLWALHLPRKAMQPHLWIGEPPGNARTDAN